MSRSMVSLVVGLLYVAACACPAVKEKNRGLELINGLLVSLGGKPDAQGDRAIRVWLDPVGHACCLEPPEGQCRTVLLDRAVWDDAFTLLADPQAGRTPSGVRQDS